MVIFLPNFTVKVYTCQKYIILQLKFFLKNSFLLNILPSFCTQYYDG